MLRVVILAAIAIAAASPPASGPRADSQIAPIVFSHADEVVKGEGFLVVADRRIFAVMALLNATGYDEEAEGQTMHPVRVQVREAVDRALAQSPGKRDTWRKFVKGTSLATFHFMDFALSLSTEVPFRRIRPDDELTYPKTAKQLRDLPDVLNDFWVTASLETIWNEVKPAYVAELAKYDAARMKHKLDFTWEYLRMPRQDAYTMVNVPNLLDKHYQSIGAHYANDYFSVESPGSHAYDLNVHEYLHSFINRLVSESYGPVKSRVAPYYKAGKDGPYAATYQNPLTFTYECLVRALDHRIAVKLKGPEAENRGRAVVDGETAKGLTLVGPFYDLLPGYETSGQGFDAYLPVLLDRLPPRGK